MGGNAPYSTRLIRQGLQRLSLSSPARRTRQPIPTVLPAARHVSGCSLRSATASRPCLVDVNGCEERGRRRAGAGDRPSRGQARSPPEPAAIALSRRHRPDERPGLRHARRDCEPGRHDHVLQHRTLARRFNHLILGRAEIVVPERLGEADHKIAAAPPICTASSKENRAPSSPS